MGVVGMGLFSFGKKKVEEPKSKEYYPESIDRTLEGITLEGHTHGLGDASGKFFDTYLNFCVSYVAKNFRNMLVVSDKLDNIDKKMDQILAQNNELKQRNIQLETELEALKRR